MVKRAIFLICIVFSSPLFAVSTGWGKILYTQGHIAPNCRTVKFKENDSGVEKYFRIQAVEGGTDNVAVAVMSALVAGREVSIHYREDVTTGCGTEPRIEYITIR